MEEDSQFNNRSPDKTRAEMSSNLSKLGATGAIVNHGFDGNISIWNVNEDISFINGQINNPLEMQTHKSNKTASTKPP